MLMDPFSLLGAGASLLGGLFDDNSAKKQAQQNYAQQKEFAQKGIGWKVEDAKASGIHPLYALGAQTHSFTPTVSNSTTGRDTAEAIANIPGQMGAKKTQALQEQLVEAKINQVNSDTARNLNDIEQSKLASQMALMKQNNINNQDTELKKQQDKLGWVKVNGQWKPTLYIEIYNNRTGQMQRFLNTKSTGMELHDTYGSAYFEAGRWGPDKEYKGRIIPDSEFNNSNIAHPDRDWETC